MNQTISVFIDDPNRFFVAGLRLALEQHFSLRGLRCAIYTARPRRPIW